MKNSDTKKFIKGLVAHVRLGVHGNTVHVEAIDGSVQIRATKPRKQVTIGADSRECRKFAVETAREFCASALPISAPFKASAAHAVEDSLRSPIVLVRDVFARLLTAKVPTLPVDVLTWGKKKLAAAVFALPENQKISVNSVDYLYSFIQSARRLDKYGCVALDSELDKLQPGDIDAHVQAVLNAGKSPNTAKTDLSRLNIAIRFCEKKFPLWWGGRGNPVRGADSVDTSFIVGLEVGEQEAELLLDTFRKSGNWRAITTTVIAHETARRVGSIAGARVGMHKNAPPLCASDIEIRNGSYYVTWRGLAQKGKGYNRGNTVRLCTPDFATTVQWVALHHPNPLGPEYPLIWDAKNPAKAATYDSLLYQLNQAWRKTFGVKKPKGLGFHGFCRTTITTIGNMLGVEAAADYSGRDVETVCLSYRLTRDDYCDEVASALSKVRKEKREAKLALAGAK